MVDTRRDNAPESTAGGDPSAPPRDAADSPGGTASAPPVGNRQPHGRALAATAAAALSAAAIVSYITLTVGGGVDIRAIPGLVAPDQTVTWLVPILKLAVDLAAVVTVGCLVAAAFFVPGRPGEHGRAGNRIGPQAYRWLRAGAASAACWAVIAAVQAPVNYADTLAVPMSGVTVDGVRSYIADTPNGRAYVLTALLAVATAVLAWRSLSVTSAALAAVVALAATLPAVFTGHSAGSDNHQLAVDSMILHVLGAALWGGGLLALIAARKLGAPTARKYSRLALVSFVAVAVSGVINAFTRISITNLVDTAYGREVLLKATALVLLGGFGYWHRRVTIPELEAGRPGAFRRLAGVEIVLMAATIGLATALSRTPPPVDREAEATVARSLLGFDMPGPITARSVLLGWYPSIIICTVAIVAVGLYLAGVRRLRARGDDWPLSRTLLWVSGWALAVFMTSSGLGKYGMVMFSVHMVQHMVLNMAVPILLVLSAPITLALRALKPSRDRGPREWLLMLLHSSFVRAVTQPLIALTLYVSSLYLMYFTGMFEWAMRSHAGHMFMVAHFMITGGLFFWLIIGPDPAPRDIGYPARVLMFFISLVFHAIFGLTIMQTTTVLAEDWYLTLGRDWGAGLLSDQRTGGGIAWAFGEAPSLVVLGALVFQWARSEEREGRRLDRAAERARASGRPEDDPHEAYNTYLAGLAEADRRDAKGDG